MPLIDKIKSSLINGRGVFRLRPIAMLKNSEFILFLIPLLLVSFVVLFPRESIFTVNAKTNVVSLIFSSSQLNQWDISSASVITDPFEPTPQYLDELDSFIFIDNGVKAQVSVIEERLHIVLNHAESVGHIDSPGLATKLGSYVEISLPIERERLFPFNASLMIGEDVSVGVSQILREATITIVEQQLFKNDRYQAGEYELEMGDKLTFYDEQGSAQPAGKGVIAVSKAEGMDIVSHTAAGLARVERLGSTGYDIRANIWARLMHDPIIAAITTLIATLFLSLEFIVIVKRIFTGKE